MNDTDYSGTGIGVWATSASASGRIGSFTLNNVSGKNVTLIWSNTDTVARSGLLSTASVVEGNSSAATRLREAMATTEHLLEGLLQKPANDKAPHFNISSTSTTYSIGASRNWYDIANEASITTTLRQQTSLSNGQKLNVWVQDGAWTAGSENYKVNQTLVDLVSNKFSASSSGVFDLVTSVAGAPWGTTGYDDLIPASQDGHIVITNLEPDNKPGGTLGYFAPLNNILKTVTGAENSNEALVFFIDSESLGSPTNAALYQDMMVSTLAHELTHMINFYQRGVRKGPSYRFDTWLEEVSAMMMEDLVNPRLVTNNTTLQNRLPRWLANGINNCSLSEFIGETSNPCFSYDIGASYGAYLLRHYGVDFYKSLLQSNATNSVMALDNAIKANDSSASFALSLQRWGAGIALLDTNQLPAGYGFPARTVSVNGTSHTLPAFNATSYASARRIASSLPTSLKAHAHAAQTFTATGSSFSRTVTVPANTVLTVVVN